MIHRVPLSGYRCNLDPIVLGTEGSYGSEFLMFEPDLEWSKLTIVVYFIRKGISKKIILGSNRIVEVPSEVTAEQTSVWNEGHIVVEGVDMTSKRYTVDFDFHVAPHTDVSDADTPVSPTPSEYEQIVAQIGEIKNDARALGEYMDDIYTDEENPAEALTDFIGIANTYYDNRTALTYSQTKTAIDTDYVAGTGNIDDSTFIQLVMMGIPYASSPYGGNTLAVGNYPWVFSPVSYGIRNAADMARYMVLAGMRLAFSGDFHEVQPGDLVFYALQTQSGAYVAQDAYLNISHVSMIRNIRQSDGYHTMLEAEPGSVITNRVLEQYNTEKIVLICRPGLSGFEYIRNYSGVARLLNEKINSGIALFNTAMNAYQGLATDIEDLREYQEGLRDDVTELKSDTSALKEVTARNSRRLDAHDKILKGQLFDFEEQVESGDNVAPSGAVAMTVLDVRGMSEQDSTNGYQMFDASAGYGTVQNYGCVFSVSDSVFTIAGTVTGQYPRVLLAALHIAPVVLQPGTYTLHIDHISGTHSFRLWNGASVYMNEDTPITITTETTFTHLISRLAYTDETMDESFRVMLSATSEPQNWEPYTGGIPAPSPDYPQEIHSVEEIRVEHTGKNLFNVPLKNVALLLGTGGVINAPNNTKRCANTDGVYVKAGTYAISYQDNLMLNTAFVSDSTALISGITVAKATYNLYSQQAYGHVTLTVNEDGYLYMYFVPRDTSSEVDITTQFVQLETGTTFTPYEPYRSEVRTIIPPRPLNAIGEYRDKLDVEKGEWKYAIESNKYDGSEYWHTATIGWTSYQYTVGLFVPKFSGNNNTPALCSHFRKSYVVSTLPLNHFVLYDKTIYIRNERFESLEAAKAWLAQNNITVYYPVESIIPIDADDLEFLRSLSVLPADNHIMITDQNGNDVSYLVEYIVKLTEV